MKRNIFTPLAGMLVALLPVTTFAQADSAAAEEKWYDNFSLGGNIHSYYVYNLNNPAGGKIAERVFDNKHNEFGLGMAQLSARYKNDKSLFVLDLNYGPGATIVNGGNGVGGESINIQNMYFSYNFTDKFLVEVGRFGTHEGIELIDASLNTHYSYSYLFRFGPYYNTGMRAKYQITDKVGAMLGVVNNWDAIDDNNKLRTLVGNVTLAPNEKLTLYFNGVYGNEGAADAKGEVQLADIQSELDFVATYAASEKLTLAINSAFRTWNTESTDSLGAKSTTNTSFFGTALYGHYIFSEKYGIGARLEYFNDGDGKMGLVSVKDGKGLNVISVTVTGDIDLAGGHVIFKPELRFDQMSDDYANFVDNDDKPKSSQATIGGAFIYKF